MSDVGKQLIGELKKVTANETVSQIQVVILIMFDIAIILSDISCGHLVDFVTIHLIINVYKFFIYTK